MLENKEKKWRDSSAEWNRKIRQWTIWQSRQKDRERLAERQSRQKKDADAPETTPASDYSWESSFNPNDPSPQFSFAGGSVRYSKEELEDDIRDLRRRTSLEDWAFEALERGIGVHHSGMNRNYRSVVERQVLNCSNIA